MFEHEYAIRLNRALAENPLEIIQDFRSKALQVFLTSASFHVENTFVDFRSIPVWGVIGKKITYGIKKRELKRELRKFEREGVSSGVLTEKILKIEPLQAYTHKAVRKVFSAAMSLGEKYAKSNLSAFMYVAPNLEILDLEYRIGLINEARPNRLKEIFSSNS